MGNSSSLGNDLVSMVDNVFFFSDTKPATNSNLYTSQFNLPQNIENSQIYTGSSISQLEPRYHQFLSKDYYHSEKIEKQLYVLKLVGNKYYVGVTNDLDRRLNEHKTGKGSEWTKLHQFDKLKYSRQVENMFVEDNEVKELMLKYGIDNVRGGSYANIKLTKEQILTLKREFSHVNNCCFHCGQIGHYAKDCPIKKQKDCDRCGRSGHNKSNCYAKTLKLADILISDLNYCSICGREDHSNQSYANYQCTYKLNRNGFALNKINSCYCEQCGRIDHTIVDCFAKSKYDGTLF